MKEKYTSNEEKNRIIQDYESRGFILIGDNGTIDGNYLEFQMKPIPIEFLLAEKDRQIEELTAKQLATERFLSESSQTQQELLELLVDAGVL